MDMVNVKINNVEYSVPAGSTVLEAAKYAGIEIPTLCYLKEINEIGACRLCLVEVKGARGLVTACVYPVNEGMEIFTNTEKVRQARKMNIQLVLSAHKKHCLSCILRSYRKHPEVLWHRLPERYIRRHRLPASACHWPH